MLAAKAPVPWRWLVVAGGVLAAGTLLRDRRAEEELQKRAFDGWPGSVEVHVKLSKEGMARSALGPYATPLFTELGPAEHDDRERWMRVDVVATSSQAVLDLLAHDPMVEEALIAPEFTLAKYMGGYDDGRRGLQPAVEPARDDDDSCPVKTPSFESYQSYLGQAPHGIDAVAAWRRGYRGAGEWFADIEGGWNADHEDLNGERIQHVAGTPIRDPAWRAHGTAVLGEVVGKDNGKGVVGIAPDIEKVFTASIGGISVPDAIDRAARKLRAGDVLLIELQTAGPQGYLPVEWYRDVFDAIRAATKRGVVVIEAAGNGYVNLDDKIYKGAFDRTKRDSGAIMVGAGAPPREGFRDRERLDYSNYGGRVDVQGWGYKVATLDYGDLQACAGADRHYTNEFSGTSSASPIVAGAAVILEGIARERGRLLAPAELRALLVKTGTPQLGNTSEHIGPRPDLWRAMAQLPR
jgi:subtilisin family serine protease